MLDLLSRPVPADDDRQEGQGRGQGRHQDGRQPLLGAADDEREPERQAFLGSRCW